jgi:hypothetical protein
MNQKDDADITPDDTPPTQEQPTAATESAAHALETVPDPEAGTVTFTIRNCDESRKLTEWLTIDSEHVVHPDEMQ